MGGFHSTPLMLASSKRLQNHSRGRRKAHVRRAGECRRILPEVRPCTEAQRKEAISTSGGVFLEKDSDELFSFEDICETLQIYPHYIRQGLMVWKEARLKTL